VEIMIDGPYFEDLHVGRCFDGAPHVTLTEGLAAAHQAVVGGRLPLTASRELSRQVLGDGVLAAPNLVWDVAIGQSTVATHTVVANLFYRGVAFRRAPRIGDSLHTVTQVVGLRENSRRPGRAPTGLAALRIRTEDQHGRPVLDFWRCAMLPLRDPDRKTGLADDLASIGEQPGYDDLATVIASWDLAAFRAARPGPHFAELRAGDVYMVAGGDVVSSAPELARLTGNVARVHHDSSVSGSRLVYGGHTIGLALHQAVRALPNLVTVVGWHSCDHLAPVREGDTLTSTLTVERVQPLASGGGLADLRSLVRSGSDPAGPADVLDWRFVGALA
jgi:acyl dehydratase